MKNPLASSTGMLKGLLSNAATGSQSNFKNNMGNYHSRHVLSAWPRTSQTFFPDTAAREREEDAAFYESMRFLQ